MTCSVVVLKKVWNSCILQKVCRLLSLSIYRTARHKFEILYTLKLNLVLPPRRISRRILFRSRIKMGFSNQWLRKKGSITNHDNQALPTLYPTLCLYSKTTWTQQPHTLCLYGKTKERTVFLRQENTNTVTPNVVPVQHDKTFCLNSKTRSRPICLYC